MSDGSEEPAPSGEPVLTAIVTICNKRGLHARAAARFVTMAEHFGASVDVIATARPFPPGRSWA